MTLNKSIIRKLAVLLVGVLIFLTFFSNTLYSLNIPGVVVGLPATGVAARTFRAEGFVDFPSGVSLHTDNAGRINFAVGRGDAVSPGDVLFTLHEDPELLLERLIAEQGRLERILVNLSRATSDLAFEENRLLRMTQADFRPTTPLPPDLTRFDNEERRLDTEIERAEESYAVNRALYEAGAVPRVTVTQAAERLDGLRVSLQVNNEDRARVVQEHERAVNQAEETDRLTQEQQQRAFNEEQQASRHRIDGFRNTILLLEMDEQYVTNTLDRLYAQAEAGGLTTVYTQYYGVVREIPAGLESGANVERNRQVMRLGLLQEDSYTVTVHFPDSIGRPPDGADSTRSVRINIPGLDEYGLRGSILRTSAASGRTLAEVQFSTTANITGGERAVVIVEHFSEISGTMLPNSAIRRDLQGYYILLIEGERNTLMGYSFYVRQQRILVEEHGDRNSAIWAFPEIELPVIVFSDRPVEVGRRVRLVGDV